MKKILLLVLFSWCNAVDLCPSKDQIAPCTCTQRPTSTDTTTEPPVTTSVVPRRRRDSHDNFITPEFINDTSLYTTVKCVSSKTLNDLEEKVSVAVYRKWIDKLVVSNIPPEQGNTLARLPADWLRDGRIRELEITHSQLIGDFIWNGNSLIDQVESLYWLKVNNCYLYGALTYDTLGTVQTRGLNALHRLKGIDFSSNHLTYVSVTAFKTPPLNLSTLILANNNIQNIDHQAFHHIPLLKHIDLSHNVIKSIFRNYFAGTAKYLEHMDLSWNFLKIIPHDFFVNMPALKSVDFSNNFLYSLPVRPWSVVWKQLSFINVSSNFIECDCELLWLPTIQLPPKSDSAVPKPLPGQTIVGRCIQSLKTDDLETVSHDLMTLKRDMLIC